MLRFLSSSMILASMRAADVGLQVAHPAQLDERGGQEAAEADVEDEAALDDLDDRAGDDAVLFLDLLDVAPGPLVLGPLLGQDEPAFLVLLGEDEGLDLVAERHDLVGVDVVADRQLAAGDHALGLVADVEQDLVPVDLDDRALDELAVLDRHHGAVDGVVEAAAEVVVGDLAGGVGAVLGEGAEVGSCAGVGGFGVGLVGGQGVVGQGSRPSGIGDGSRGHGRAGQGAATRRRAGYTAAAGPGHGRRATSRNSWRVDRGRLGARRRPGVTDHRCSTSRPGGARPGAAAPGA